MKIQLKPLAGPALNFGDEIAVDLSVMGTFMFSRFPKISDATPEAEVGDFEGTPCLYLKDRYLSFPHSLITLDDNGQMQIKVAHGRVRNPIFVNQADPAPETGVLESSLVVGDRIQLGTNVFEIQAAGEAGWAAVFGKAYPDLGYLNAIELDPAHGHSIHRTRSREGFTIAVECREFGPMPAAVAEADELVRRMNGLKQKQADDKALARATPRIYDVRHVDIPGAGHCVFMAREPIELPTLEKLALADSRPMPVSQALRFGIRLCEAVSNFHRFGLHRQLTPTTVYLDLQDSPDNDRVVLGGLFGFKPDFGADSIAKEKFNGWAVYRPPEQIEHDEYTERSDMYVVALLIASALSGCVPFVAKNPLDLKHQILYALPQLPDSVPPRLKAVLAKAWAKKANQRFHLMLDFRRQLLRLWESLLPTSK